MAPSDSPQANPSSNDSAGIYACILILAFSATLAVALRFWARRLMHVSWQIDDYLALAALMIHHGLIPVIAIAIELGGLGQDTNLYRTAHPGSTVMFYQAFYIGSVIYAVSSPVIKLSVLCFYRRIFPTKTMKIACVTLASLIIIWAVVVGVVDFFLCTPLHAFWDVELQSSPSTKCLDITSFWLVNSGSNGAIDLATLVLPVYEVVKLRGSASRKIGICAVFLLGSVALAASLTRTITTIPLHDLEVTNPNTQYIIPGVSTVVEIYVATIGACLPTLLPVYRRLRYGNATKKIKYSYSAGKGMRSIKTIGQISYRGHSGSGADGSSTEALCIDYSFEPSYYQRIHQLDASVAVDCAPARKSTSSTVRSREIEEVSSKECVRDGNYCSAV